MCQVCCAILAALSYNEDSHELLGEPAVLQALFQIGEEEAYNTQMTVAVCICNLSANPAFRGVLLDKQVVKALTALSAAGGESVQKVSNTCETVLCCVDARGVLVVLTFVCGATVVRGRFLQLDLRGMCGCNKARRMSMKYHAVLSPTFLPHTQAHRHRDLLKEGAMTSLFMIALVRAVGTHTKQVCAQALLNLVGGDCVEQLIREGVVRAFATLSFLECEVTQVGVAC